MSVTANEVAVFIALESHTEVGGEPAWKLLDADQHLQTLNPNYAPVGVLEMIPLDVLSVLDIGCFCGGSGRFLKARRPDVSVVGIEISAKAAEIAAVDYDRVIVGALESVDLSSLGRFEAIVAADVLEHLANPWKALRSMTSLLAPGGQIYASVPNVRNLRVVDNLANGRWPHQGAGINDVSHLRFFTRSEIARMFAETGWSIGEMRCNLDQQVVAHFRGADLATVTRIETQRMVLKNLGPEDLLELMTLQFQVRATVAE